MDLRLVRVGTAPAALPVRKGAAMIPRELGAGWFPAVAIVDDLVYVAYGTAPAPLMLVVLTREGIEIRRQTLPGFLDSFPAFSGRWLAYKRNLDWRPVAIDVVSGQEFVFQGQADGNFGLTVNDALGVVAYQWTTAYQVWLGSLIDGVSHNTQLTGAADGLSELPALDRVVLRKDVRLSVPGLTWPVRRGDFVVGEKAGDYGIACQLDGDVLRVALVGQDTPTPSCATDGQTYAMVTGGPQGVRLWLGSRADLQALPAASSITAPPADVPRIGRPLWLGWFLFGDHDTDAPGNCVLPVGDGGMFVMSSHHADGVVAHYVAGNPDSDMDALEQAIAGARVEQAIDGLNIPVLAYWTRGGQAVRLPASADIIGVEAYRLVDESLTRFEARVRSHLALCPRAWIIAQGYTSNASQHTDLAALVPVYARIARDCPNVEGILVFSAGSRKTGWDDHPEVHDVWRRLADGIPGAPVVSVAPRPGPTPHPAPAPRPAPAPSPVPAPPPATSPQPLPHEGVLLMFSLFTDPTKHLLAVKSVKSVSNGGTVLENLDGTIVSIQPDGSVQTRPAGADGGYERCKASGNVATFKPADQYYTFPFVVVDGL